MTKSKFRVIDATDKAAVDIAQVLANKTAQKILERIARKSATAGELVKELNISASTIHYNLKLLKASHLIVEEAMHYSPKGKEVIHYKVTDEHIIISPKRSFNLAEKLQAFVPALLLLLVFFSIFQFAPSSVMEQNDVMQAESIAMDTRAMPQAAMLKVEEPIEEPQTTVFDTVSLFVGSILGLILAFLSLVVVYLFKKK